MEGLWKSCLDEDEWIHMSVVIGDEWMQDSKVLVMGTIMMDFSTGMLSSLQFL